jgi:lysophospholipase L1-like esterase
MTIIRLTSLVILIFMAAMKNPDQIQSSAAAKQKTYLALGDSYTIGEKVDPKENFPSQVVRLLREKGFDFSDPRIVAQTGWTTDELQAAIKKGRLRRHYDFVTLLIGVNNQYRGRKVVEYLPEFESLLKQAIRYAGDTSRVIVLSIPDWGVTPFAEGKDRKQIAAEIDEYNAASKLITAKYKVQYIDITESTRDAAKDITLLASDSLHPSAKEYGKWAKEVADVIKSKL